MDICVAIVNSIHLHVNCCHGDGALYFRHCVAIYILPKLPYGDCFRERLLRLEHENKMLIARSTDGAPDGDPERLWHLLDDDANARLESEIRYFLWCRLHRVT